MERAAVRAQCASWACGRVKMRACGFEGKPWGGSVQGSVTTTGGNAPLVQLSREPASTAKCVKVWNRLCYYQVIRVEACADLSLIGPLRCSPLCWVSPLLLLSPELLRWSPDLCRRRRRRRCASFYSDSRRCTYLVDKKDRGRGGEGGVSVRGDGVALRKDTWQPQLQRSFRGQKGKPESVRSKGA